MKMHMSGHVMSCDPPLSGVVTFCRSSATPVRAEEGLTGALAVANDGVGLTGGCPTHFTNKADVCLRVDALFVNVFFLDASL